MERSGETMPVGRVNVDPVEQAISRPDNTLIRKAAEKALEPQGKPVQQLPGKTKRSGEDKRTQVANAPKHATES